MARPSRSEQTYYAQLAAVMVRETKTIKQAASELGMAFTNEELLALEKRKGFQEVLWAERHRFYKELATDPERGKISIIGQMIFNIQKLQDAGQAEKAIEGLLKMAKVEGYVGADQQVSVFTSVTPKDLEEAKRTIVERLKQGGGITQEPGTA